MPQFIGGHNKYPLCKVKRKFCTGFQPQNRRLLLYLQCLIQKLRQIIRNGGLADHQCGAGLLRGGLQLRRLLAGKRDNRNVLGGGIRFQRGDGAANGLVARSKSTIASIGPSARALSAETTPDR